ncbi:MAG: DUF6088 family protein [Prevotellaceae bacterium]|nr:DUF6088 family protein [Prevotellaceae bacterium]MDY3365444.1 DUF6088 family protein [Prevotella sp.]
MPTQSSIISKQISGLEAGTVFFSSDLSDTGVKSPLIQKVLERETNAGRIMRLGQGIYYMPKVDDVYGLGIIYPSLEEIARRLAERDKVRIEPTGANAANLLGLSTQVPMNLCFLTDGSSKEIKMSNGRTLKFIHAPLKNFTFTNRTLMLITFALKEIGKDNIQPEQTDRIRKLLANIPLEQAKVDLKLMPAWIRNFILSFYDKVL